MNITELVKSINTPYYETVASRLPRGIKSQEHLLNLGYEITVRDLGLPRAKTLDESFAVNLINSYHRQCINEGVGSFLGKAAGNVVGAVGALEVLVFDRGHDRQEARRVVHVEGDRVDRAQSLLLGRLIHGLGHAGVVEPHVAPDDVARHLLLSVLLSDLFEL